MADQAEKFMRSGKTKYYVLVVKEDDNRFRWRAWNITKLNTNKNDNVLHQIDDKGDLMDYFSDMNYEEGYKTLDTAIKAADKFIHGG